MFTSLYNFYLYIYSTSVSCLPLCAFILLFCPSLGWEVFVNEDGLSLVSNEHTQLFQASSPTILKDCFCHQISRQECLQILLFEDDVSSCEVSEMLWKTKILPWQVFTFAEQAWRTQQKTADGKSFCTWGGYFQKYCSCKFLTKPVRFN